MASPMSSTTVTTINTEQQCLNAMTRLRALKATTTNLQQQLNVARREQKQLIQAVGAFLSLTNRESVRMGDLVVQAETKTIAPKVNILTTRNSTAKQVMDELALVGVTVSPEQWMNLVQHMRTSQVRTKRDIKLIVG